MKVVVNTYDELASYLNDDIKRAMDATCKTLKDALGTYIDEAIYNDGVPKEYNRTEDFKISYQWDNADIEGMVQRILYSHDSEINRDFQDSGWGEHVSTFGKTHGQDIKMDELFNSGHMWTNGNWRTHTEPYWDNFRAEWTDEKIINEFYSNLEK